MASKGLSDAHNDITRVSQRRVDRHIADHTCHQPVVSIAGPKGLFQQLDAQSFNLVDVLCASKPAVYRSNMTFSRACAYLSRQQCSDRRTGQRFRRQEIETPLPTPLLIPRDSRQDSLLHLFWRAASIQDNPRVSKYSRIVNLGLIN
jgi:hypothetical protein